MPKSKPNKKPETAREREWAEKVVAAEARPDQEWDPTLEYDFSSLPLVPGLNTSAVAYYVWRNGGIEPDIVDFRMYDGRSFVSDIRAFRRQRRRKRKLAPRLSEGAMHDPALIVVFGPRTGAGRAILSLRKMADLIEERGLIIGNAGKGTGEYYEKEYVEGRGKNKRGQPRTGERKSGRRAPGP
jgi:hypothetical protein